MVDRVVKQTGRDKGGRLIEEHYSGGKASKGLCLCYLGSDVVTWLD